MAAYFAYDSWEINSALLTLTLTFFLDFSPLVNGDNVLFPSEH